MNYTTTAGGMPLVTLETTEYRGYTITTYFNKREIWVVVYDKNGESIYGTIDLGLLSKNMAEQLTEARAFIDEQVSKEANS